MGARVEAQERQGAWGRGSSRLHWSAGGPPQVRCHRFLRLMEDLMNSHDTCWTQLCQTGRRAVWGGVQEGLPEHCAVMTPMYEPQRDFREAYVPMCEV